MRVEGGTLEDHQIEEMGLALMHVFGRSGYNEWLPTPRKSHRYLIERMSPTEMGRDIEADPFNQFAGAFLQTPPSLNSL